jgi:hypothetical protein
VLTGPPAWALVLTYVFSLGVGLILFAAAIAALLWLLRAIMRAKNRANN